MIAQKLKDGKILIGNCAPKKDAECTITGLRVAEFFRLSKCTNNWVNVENRRDAIWAYTKENSPLQKEFLHIFNKREKARKELEIGMQEKEKASENVYVSKVNGKYRLAFIKNKKCILLLERHGNANLNKPNSVCIDDKTKDEFIADCFSDKQRKTKQPRIRQIDKKELYQKWLEKINQIYTEGKS